MKEYKYAKLKGRILEKFGTQESFAKAIGVSRVTVNGKLNNNVQFTQSDVERWTEALEIDRSDIVHYFYA